MHADAGIVHEDLQPAVHLHGRARAWARRLGAGEIDLSMTHSRELASATCVVETR